MLNTKNLSASGQEVFLEKIGFTALLKRVLFKYFRFDFSEESIEYDCRGYERDSIDAVRKEPHGERKQQPGQRRDQAFRLSVFQLITAMLLRLRPAVYFVAANIRAAAAVRII